MGDQGNRYRHSTAGIRVTLNNQMNICLQLDSFCLRRHIDRNCLHSFAVGVLVCLGNSIKEHQNDRLNLFHFTTGSIQMWVITQDQSPARDWTPLIKKWSKVACRVSVKRIIKLHVHAREILWLLLCNRFWPIFVGEESKDKTLYTWLKYLCATVAIFSLGQCYHFNQKTLNLGQNLKTSNFS